MQTVGRAVKRSGTIGEPLPDTYRSLKEAEVFFRRGATSMVAGHPGSFKSTFALNLAMAWSRKGIVILYISADSDEFTVGKRCSSILTGDPMSKVDESLRVGGYADVLNDLVNVHWEFRPLNVKQIDDRLLAIEQMHGKKPDLIVVDNLMNMVDNPTDYSGQMIMTRDLDTMARGASSHVMILHHTHENPQSQNKATTPQPIWEIHGKVNQFPRLILTLAAEGAPDHNSAHLMVACVKNSVGPDDRTAREYQDFTIETRSARVREIPRV